ncbi:hypothetical protein [Embleya sp. NPDC001921]
MTGPEHYRRAEIFLASARAVKEGHPDRNRLVAECTARAHAHATMALAAATAALLTREHIDPNDYADWREMGDRERIDAQRSAARRAKLAEGEVPF